MIKILLIILLSLINLNSPIFSLAQIGSSSPNQFITIVNPVRLSSYNKDPQKSLSAEYEEIHKRSLPATWLLTYDAMSSDKMVDLTKQMDNRQELGILLEVTVNFAKDSGVRYNQSGSWHRPNSLFLSGYTQEDRIRLIDTVFSKFKSRYDYYPKSVGAWWIDSYSLEYMQKKYGVTSNMGCSDQFSTDGYSLWGQYWSTPFYPSKYHAGVPASDKNSKLDIVSLQWAARDPLNGYGSGHHSTYSTQDYHTQGLTSEYYEKLIKLYAEKNRNQFGQITLGLEADLSEGVYQSIYASHLDILKKLERSEKFEITTMNSFSSWYRNTFPNISPPHVIESDDLLTQKIKSIWFQSPSYRIGLTINLETDETLVRDFRTYQDNFQEPFYESPNSQTTLYINIPSVIDQVSNPQNTWVIKGKILSIDGTNDKFIINYPGDKSLILTYNKITLTNISSDIPLSIKQSPQIKINEQANSTQLTVNKDWFIPSSGLVIRHLSPKILYLLNSENLTKTNNIKRLIAISISLAIISFIVFKFRLYKKRVLKLVALLICVGISFLLIYTTRLYFISQGEVDALLHLKALPKGRVIVYNQNCLRCLWHSKNMPAAFVNMRDYVSQISDKPLIYNSSIFTTLNREEGKRILDKLGAKYIYLVKFEDYIESLPFSEGDLNVEKVYENANAQIWQIKN